MNFRGRLQAAEAQGSVGVQGRMLGCREHLTGPRDLQGWWQRVLNSRRTAAWRSTRARGGGGVTEESGELSGECRQEGGVSCGWARGGRGEGFGVMRCDMTVSLVPGRGGRGFLFLVLVATHLLFLSEGRETVRKNQEGLLLPPQLPGFLCPSSMPRKSRHPYPLLCPLGTLSLCLQVNSPLFPVLPVLPSGRGPLFSQPDSQLAHHHQPVNPLTQRGHWSASWPAPAHPLASSL